MSLKRWWLRVDFDDEVKRLPKPQLRMLIYFTVLSIGYADHLLGYQFGFSIFYLLPIIIATRNLGRNNGLFISLMCAGLWSLMDFMHGA